MKNRVQLSKDIGPLHPRNKAQHGHSDLLATFTKPVLRCNSSANSGAAWIHSSKNVTVCQTNLDIMREQRSFASHAAQQLQHQHRNETDKEQDATPSWLGDCRGQNSTAAVPARVF